MAFPARAFSARLAITSIMALLFDIEAISFDEFVLAHGRQYREGTPEYELRRNIFESRADEVRVQNGRPGRLWTAGLNHLSDWTRDEFDQLLGWRRSGVKHALRRPSLLAFGSAKLSDSVDWRNLTATRRIADQGGCGSCWANAASTVLEANYQIAWGSERTFSVQELVNCVENPKECGGQGGCAGATVELAMEYVLRSGLSTSSEVPYIGSEQVCSRPSLLDTSGIGRIGNHYDHNGGVALGMKSWATLPKNSALPLLVALMRGPVAVSVGANYWSIYFAGVFDGCGADAIINHAVVAVGYGSDSGVKYWTIQNSWGKSWGEDGYMRLLRVFDHGSSEQEQCGTDHDPSAGIACKPYPESDVVCGMCGILYDSVQPTFSSLAEMSGSSKSLRGVL
mmetsp:Transcript_92720/g.261839  ORF Transcript_92720/g.261839 Transcript_92720/m.261839 type:complete len:396 (-) Transcript_92720:111-1298(-)